MLTMEIKGFGVRNYDPDVAHTLAVDNTADQLRSQVEEYYGTIVGEPAPVGLRKMRKADLAALVASLMMAPPRLKPHGQTSTLYPKSRRPRPATRSSRRQYTKNVHRHRRGEERLRLLSMQQ